MKRAGIGLLVAALCSGTAWAGVATLPGGSITTTSLGAWASDRLVFPGRCDFSAGPTIITVNGLDLTDVWYEGEWPWPPISTSQGAQARFGITADGFWSMHSIHSAFETGGDWDQQSYPWTHDDGFRKYLVQNQWSGTTPGVTVGNHQYNVEAYIPRTGAGPSVNDPNWVTDRAYNTFDMRIAYTPTGIAGEYTVQGQVRLHKAASWTEMNTRPGTPTDWNTAHTWVWNPAINNQASSDDAWQPFFDGSWNITGDYTSAQPYFEIINWGVPQNRYHTCSWDSMVIEGALLSPTVTMQADAPCYGVNDIVTVDLVMDASMHEVFSGQFWIEFDDSVLSFLGAEGVVPWDGYTLVNPPGVSPAANQKYIAVGVDPFGGSGAYAGTMVRLTFTAIEEICDAAGLVLFLDPDGDPPTRLGGPAEQEEIYPEKVDLAAITIDSTPPEITCPADESIECDVYASTVTIDGVIDEGEWDHAVTLDASGIGTVALTSDSEYLYVLFDLNDPTDARLGENLVGNDQIGLNINPTDGGSWGYPYDLVFETGADPAAWGGGSSGQTDGWESRLYHSGAMQSSLPDGLETATLYDPTRVTEWRIPLAVFGAGVGDPLKVGGAVDVGDGNSYVFPPGLDWSDASTFASFTVNVHTAGSGQATAEDTCDPDPEITYADEFEAGACPGTGTITRTWTATDYCGNSASCVQTIEVVDTTAPVITCPDDITVNADAGLCEATVDVYEGVQTFDDDPVLSEAQARGVWYTDRYAPAGFVSATFANGKRLKHSIDAADGANTRPDDYSGEFYNTQGRKYDTPGSTKMSVDLYVPAEWETTGRRMAGFWGTCFDNAAAISLYPIVEFTSDGAQPRFRVWPDDPFVGGWIDLGLPSNFVYGAWYTLTIELVGSNVTLTVGDVSHTLWANDSVEISNAILQGHNTADGVTYDIYWDNFQYETGPIAQDNCDPAPVITYERSDDPTLTLDDPFPAGVTTITWTATDCAGNSSTCAQTVTVNAVNELVVDLALNGAGDGTGPFDRCIEFNLLGPDGPQTVQQVVTFTDGHADGVVVEVPCGEYTCIEARDPLHSLWSAHTPDEGESTSGAEDGGLQIVGTQYVADFTADSGIYDNRLVLGNLNGDEWIDVIDFAIYVVRFGDPFDVNVDCDYTGRHPDFNGDGLVDTGDFTVIQTNFLTTDDLCTTQVRGTAPVTRIAVRDLVRLRLTELAPADLNQDGWIDAQDIAAFASGVRPDTEAEGPVPLEPAIEAGTQIDVEPAATPRRPVGIRR